MEFSSRRQEPARVLARDGDADLALLAVTPRTLPAPPLSGAARAGEPVTLSGCPGGACFALAAGRITGVFRPLLGVPLVQMRAKVLPGSSGGPVVDDAGRILGLVAYRDLRAPGLAYFIPIDAARPLLTASLRSP